MKTTWPTSLSLSLFAALALPASQQTVAQTDLDREVVELDQLTVTDESFSPATPTVVATKLPLSIRQTPQSISVFGRDRIDAELLTSVDDVLRNTTGVHVSYYDSERPLYFARGFQITDFMVDGMPTYSGSTNQEYDTALYEHVEILRGANGLLTGAGIPSAVVNLTRKHPGQDFASSLSTNVGSWNLFRVESDVTVPLSATGRIRSRFVVATQHTDDFVDRYENRKLAGLATVEADLTTTTTIGIGYQYQDNDPSSPTWGTIPRFAADGSLARLPRSTNFSPNWTQWDRTSGTTFATLDQQLGADWRLHLAYNHTEGETYSLRVYASGFPDLATGSGIYLRAGIGQTEDTRETFDAYLSGQFSLFGREHDFALGWNLNNYDSTAFNFTSITSGTYAWRYDIPDYRTWQGDAPIPTSEKNGTTRTSVTDQSGLYTTARLHPTDRSSIIVGARLSQWETRTLNYDVSGALTSTTSAYTVSDEVTPYVGAVFDLNHVWSAYASYTDVFRPQNYKDKDNNLLSPVLGTNLEIGLKAEFFAKRFQITVSAFQTEQDNYAVRDISVPDYSLPDGNSAYLGVDGTQSEGFEVELTGYLRPGWTASFGYSHVNTTRHPSDLTYANVPEHLLRLHTQYQFSGALKKLSSGLGVTWQGDQTGVGITHPTLGTTTVQQKAFALVNLNATYHLSEHLNLTAAVRNVFDQTYWATLDYPNYGEPRAASISLRWTY